MFGDKKQEKIKVVGIEDFPEDVRAMSYGQLREFRKAGLDPRYSKTINEKQLAVLAAKEKVKGSEEKVEISDIQEVSDAALVILNIGDDMVDWILTKIYPDYDFYMADDKACGELAAKVYGKTVPSGAEIKNL